MKPSTAAPRDAADSPFPSVIVRVHAMDGLNARPSNPLHKQIIKPHRLQTHFTSSSSLVPKKEGHVNQ
jgi:hypothetical protein